MVRSSKEAQLCAGIVFVASLLLYCRTLAPTVTLVDSGELIVTAHFLGVAHPPGFPLYMMLAHLASLVPWGSVALRVNAASALFAALASAMLTLVVAELMMVASSLAALKRSPKKKSGKKMPHGIGLEMERNFRLVVLAPALVSGLLLAFSRTHWSYATIAEVYTLNTLLILSVFFLTLRWRRRIMEDERRVTADVNRPRAVGITDYDSLLNAAALGFGLALGVHHVTVGLILPALAIIVYKTEGAAFFTSRRLLYAALFSIAGLCAVYSYLPLAASGDAVINWGRPRSLQEIWSHFIGRQYQNYFSFAPEMLGRQVLAFGELACRQFGRWWLPLALVLAGAGVSYAFKRDRTTFWFLAPIAFANVAYTLGYDIAEDKDAYYLPTFVAVATAAGYGLRSLFEFALSRRWSTQKIHLLAAFLVVLVPAIALASNWPFNNRRQYFIAQDYVENIQSAIAPNGLLLTLDWQVQAPMLYTREVEQHRRDVKVVDINLLRRSWYFDYLQRAYPDLLERSRQKVDRFVVELQLWEQDPEAYRKDARLTQRIEFAFHEMLQSFVTEESKVAPVYVTSEVMFMTQGSERTLTAWIVKNYQPVPRGLVFQLTADRSFYEAAALDLQTRGLADGTLHFEKDDVVTVKVLPAYTQMFVQTARYLAFRNQHERAITAFEQALLLDPNLKQAQQGRDESRSRIASP